MKTKITTVLLFCNLVFTSAQQQNNSFENLINQEYGTLLESLLIDGKLNNNNAKIYLEAVYGYNLDINNYLQNADFSSQLNSLNGKKLNTVEYIEKVNSSLLSSIPNDKFQELSQNIQDGLMFYNGVYDITQGNLSSNALGVGFKVFDFFSTMNKMMKEDEIILEKVKNITPTLDKLNKASSRYKKLKLVEDFSSNKNWNISKAPPFVKYSKHITTTNYTDIKNKCLTITTQNYNSGDWLGLGISKEVVYKKARLFRNNEKFDFSKDFSLTMDIKFNFDKENDVFVLYIGKGFFMDVKRYKKYTYFMASSGTGITKEYGELEALYDKEKKEIKDYNKAKGIYKYSGPYGESVTYEYKKNPTINFNDILTIKIVKKGNTFTGTLVNDTSGVEFKVENVTFFPDKYYLGFKLKSYNKNAEVEIHRLELEHL